MLPVIALTPGEPSGIGPDITVKIAQTNINARLLCFADPELLIQRASLLGITISINTITDPEKTPPHTPGQLSVFPVSLKKPVLAGKLNKENAAYVLQTLTTAVSFINNKTVHALVTGPVHKGIINDAGINFTGHTEFLAELTGGTPVMMLAAHKLRVALATTHLPLSEVSNAITQTSLEQVIRILHHDLLTLFAIHNPTILVCGLNPHAGEDGHLGHEEITIIKPVLEKLKDENMNLIGPLPADSLFTPHYLEQADAVLAMYHDQGLPVLKHVGFGHSINITLGLPIIRTSVDHGTALELAATDKADTGSLQAAIKLAIDLAKKRFTLDKQTNVDHS
ncbi:MAG: 4-hydroxythreonine-4-phosphate dehydrogenase PdxA [Gammaproteobacteria bacterium]|nr:4-hydroxythreonine-4-phosphate dehydrogenase PdxA [Gammaproteobacteria bacterium]MDH5734901.1 4-hydroxythreonine-4-phosphate dehydrogenase PdxA [Gammaproteobacteria bacterium]